MVRKTKRFADGGAAQSRYDRKTKDIESDYQKALKAGKEAGVAKAKYEQRMADAKDDLAKWTKADRTETSAAEKRAESALSEARRTKGESIRRRDKFGAELETKVPDLTANRANTIKDVPSTSLGDSMTFAEKFRAERKDQGSGGKFTWRGKSYSTNMAGEGAKPAALKAVQERKAPPTPVQKREAPPTPVQKREAPPTPVQKREAPPTPVQNKSRDPWAKDPKGNFLDTTSAGSRARASGGYPSQSSAPTGAYGALSDYYKQKADTEAKAKQARATAEEKAAKERAAAAKQRSDAMLANSLTKYPIAGINKKKGGAIKKSVKKCSGASMKKYAKGGSVDGCAIRGKTRAPLRKQ